MEDTQKKKENGGMTVWVLGEWKESGGLSLRTGSDIALLVAGAGHAPSPPAHCPGLSLLIWKREGLG